MAYILHPDPGQTDKERQNVKEKPDHYSLEQATQRLAQIVRPARTETVPTARALHRVMAKDLVSPEYLPPFARSPYDGFAFCAADTADATHQTPATLRIIEEVRAGYVPTRPLQRGEAVKILTGAPMPSGADAVVKYEDVRWQDDVLTIGEPHASAENVVPMGEDVSRGDLVARRGTKIPVPMIGLLAALGVAEVPVFAVPRVAVISTGDELVDLGQPLGPGKIRNSSRYTIEGLLQDAGAEAFYAGTAPDETDRVAALMADALKDADMLISTGGVSVGDYDVIRLAVDALGATTLFWKIAIKPGGSMLAASLDGKLILGLSGSPSAAAIGMHLVGLPFVRALGGGDMRIGEKIRVRLIEDFKKSSRTRRFVWGKLVMDDGQALFHNTGRQANGVLSAICGADLLGEIPSGSPPLPKGTPIDAYRIG